MRGVSLWMCPDCGMYTLVLYRCSYDGPSESMVVGSRGTGFGSFFFCGRSGLIAEKLLPPTAQTSHFYR